MLSLLLLFLLLLLLWLLLLLLVIGIVVTVIVIVVAIIVLLVSNMITATAKDCCDYWKCWNEKGWKKLTGKRSSGREVLRPIG